VFKSYFKTGWRNLIKNKGYTAINILGLAAGMAVALLIGLWVYNEYSYDKFLPGYQQLFRVKRNFNSNDQTLTLETVSLKLADALRREIPEIERVAESDWMVAHGLMVGDKKLYSKGAQIAGDFLNMFQYPLLQGNRNNVLKDPYSIVLTESTAHALFGNEDPLGKTVRFDNKNDLKVTGLLQDVPANSSLQFNYLVPFSYYEQAEDWVKQARGENYSWNEFQIFVQLKPGISYAQVAPKIKDIEKTEKDNLLAINSDVILQPLQNWHLYSTYENGKETGGFVQYVRMFSIIGALVMFIACINFINLATARSEKRAKEVAVRKAIGSQRKNLIIQFLTESFLCTLIGFLFAILLVQLVLPAFNNITGSEISIPYFNILFWLLAILFIITITLIAGGRPAFYLSSFKPVKILRGERKVGKIASLPRKILVVIQFSCSVALIVSTLVIYRQIQYAKDRPVGYNINRLMSTDMNSDLNHQYVAIKNELLQSGIVESVSAASSPAADLYWHSNIDRWPGQYAGETVQMGTAQIAEDYFKTLEIQFKSGRDFLIDADSTNVILNETAVKRLRFSEPLNQIISWQGRTLQVIGVVKDAVMLSPFAPTEPMMYLYHPHYENFLIYRLSPNVKTHEAIEKLTTIFNKYNPAFPYMYEFSDQHYAAKFSIEVLVGKLAGIFAGLAIIISCVGLFGLTAFIAEQRSKEIGIRKILGASVSQLWLLLSKEFIVLVLVSCVIASPVAYYFLQNWLQKYDYRIGISPLIFLMAALMALIITIGTISYQAIRAAIANPTKVLRTE